MALGLSVRSAAVRVCIHPATAFRWRHALLDERRRRDTDLLSGLIELDSMWFLFSDKGKRGPQRAGQAIGALYRPRGGAPLGAHRSDLLGANVLVACDSNNSVVTEVVNVGVRMRIDRQELDAVLARRTRSRMVCGLRADPMRFAPATFSRRQAQPPFFATRRIYTERAYGYVCRFLGWLRRFCGVATRYLRNYLIWHRRVDGLARADAATAMLFWPVRTNPLAEFGPKHGPECQARL